MTLSQKDVVEMENHCFEFRMLKGVGKQRGCDSCQAGETECWEHFCETVLKQKYVVPEIEVKRRKWLDEANGLSDKICELEKSAASLSYSIDLLDLHRSQVRREINDLKAKQEAMRNG